MSDLAILLGGAVSSDNQITRDRQRASFVWLASLERDGYVCAVRDDGELGFRLCLHLD